MDFFSFRVFLIAHTPPLFSLSLALSLALSFTQLGCSLFVMQAPFQQQLQPSLSTTTRQLPHNLPSPDSDLDSTSMVILPSSPSSAIVNSPSTTTTTTTNDTDSQPTPMVVPAKRGYKSHVPSACK